MGLKKNLQVQIEISNKQKTKLEMLKRSSDVWNDAFLQTHAAIMIKKFQRRLSLLMRMLKFRPYVD